MNFRIYSPAASLAPYVKHYYHLQNSNDGLLHLPQNLFSLGDLYMVFLQEGEVTFQPEQHASFTLPKAAVVGHFTCHHTIKVQGPVKMTVVQLNAYGCYKLAGLNMSAFNNYYRDLLKQDSGQWQHLVEAIQQTTNFMQLDAVLDKVFIDMMSTQEHPLKQMDEVADYMLRHQGHVNIERLVRKFKISRPTLERKFMEVIGITPQLYARMLRFRDAMRHMQQMNVEQWQSFITKSESYNQDLFNQDFQFFKGSESTIARMPVAQTMAVA
ncbi:DUF6597 domain-containing transcriptional factor [Chitinophaga sancti]|uniref:DUF6597 domain-containing transcriptional factor n=1 Tax=Chitinophaga sancti TaxID=1004 RepID=UPI002A759AFF|nr:DUF6597 domain-containing transcriptional factor [Chitinophaga sancti]WPQ65695.1 DUF6597 domain-containing transcriptional factor [Chitinophaga sancti]